MQQREARGIETSEEGRQRVAPSPLLQARVSVREEACVLRDEGLHGIARQWWRLALVVVAPRVEELLLSVRPRHPKRPVTEPLAEAPIGRTVDSCMEPLAETTVEPLAEPLVEDACVQLSFQSEK